MSKLDRLEIKEIKKIMIYFIRFIAVYMLLSVIASVVMNNAFNDTAFTMRIIMVLCSALCIICAAMIMFKRFYNILFTNEGLIRFAYPVENNAHLKANLKCGLIWLFFLLVIFFAGLGISDVITRNRVDDWGVGNLYSDLMDSYTSNILSNPGFKTVVTVIILIAAAVAVVINFYMSFLFTLTVARRICGKYNILQKNGVIFITGIVMYNIHMILVEAMSWIENAYSEYWMYNEGYSLFEQNWVFIEEIDRPLANIVVYGATALIMYRICRNILDKKLDI